MVAHLRSLGWNVSDQYSHEDLTVDRMFTTTSAIVDKKRSRSLRIDAMCDRKGSRVAFEYNGPYHYYCKKIKRKPTIASLNNDWCKRLWCRSNGVRVICVSPAAPTSRDYLDFRYKVSSLATCLPLKGKMKYTADSVRFLNAIGDVPKYLMHLGMWTVYVIRDDDACTTCLVVYSIDPGYECYCEGAGFCVVRQREPSLCAFAVTSWWREKQLEKDVVAYSKARDRGGDRVVSMDDYSSNGESVHMLPVHIHVPRYRSTNSRYLACRIIDEVDDVALFLLPDQDLLFGTKTIKECVADLFFAAKQRRRTLRV